MEVEAYRCEHCGNKTRFDVFETVRRRRYAHFTLAGEPAPDDGGPAEEVLERMVERVVCRYCQRELAN